MQLFLLALFLFVIIVSNVALVEPGKTMFECHYTILYSPKQYIRETKYIGL